MAITTRDEYRDAVEKLAARNGGRVTPEDVIEAAKDRTSPLHDYFTWDNKDAAHKQRLYEARELIRSIRVTVVVDDLVLRTIAYVRDPRQESAKQGYIATAVLRTDTELARAVLLEEFGRASSAMKRALEVADAVGLKPDVQQYVDGIASLRKRVEQHAD